MSQQLPADQRAQPDASDAIAVVSAYGAFRLLLGLLAAWSFFAGFALIIGALEFGDDALARRVVGTHMVVLSPVYALLAWRRTEYRLFIWMPYAAQAAIVLPGLWELVINQNLEGALVLVVSSIFLVLLVYLWTSSHPLGFFAPAEEADEDDEAADADTAPDLDREREFGADAAGRARRYRRSE
jgi:hypothetical protein